jgi:hypothetical protein
MKHLTGILCLTIAVLLGSSGVSYALPECPEDQNQRYHNCFGTYTYANGHKFVGEWRNGKYHGQGTFIYVNGDKYVGEYKNNKSVNTKILNSSDKKRKDGAGLPSSNIIWLGDYQKGVDAAARGDFVTTLKEWKPLAEQGHPDAQRGLGLLYIKGKGVSQDDKTAIKWYKLAAEQGHMVAQNELGVFYYKGQGVPKDIIRAKMWISIVASSGEKDAVKKKYLSCEKNDLFSNRNRKETCP